MESMTDNSQKAKQKRDFKDASYGHLARIGKALASPKRLELLDLLCQSERTVEDLACETRMSLANTSQHLQVLQGARLVETSKNGRYVARSEERRVGKECRDRRWSYEEGETE